MARRLGYGGLANTNGARDFSGKAEAEIVIAVASSRDSYAKYHMRSGRHILPWLVAGLEVLRQLLQASAQ